MGTGEPKWQTRMARAERQGQKARADGQMARAEARSPWARSPVSYRRVGRRKARRDRQVPLGIRTDKSQPRGPIRCRH